MNIPITDDLRTLAESNGIAVPDWYLQLLDEFAGRTDIVEIYDSVELTRSLNADCVKNGAWGCRWEPAYWAIGGDGAGGIYFFDSSNPQSPVYYIDHEDPPASIEEDDHILAVTPDEFREDILQGIRDFEKHAEEMREKVKNRKWWQLWIPRKVPRWACQQGGASDASGAGDL